MMLDLFDHVGGKGYTPYFRLRFFNDLKRTCKWTPYHRSFCLILTTALRAAGSSLVIYSLKVVHPATRHDTLPFSFYPS